MRNLSPRKVFSLTVLVVCCTILACLLSNALQQSPFDAQCHLAESLAQKDPENAEIAYKKLLADVQSAKGIPDYALCNVYEKYGDFAYVHSRFRDACNLYKTGEEYAKKIARADYQASFLVREGFAQHFAWEGGEGDAPDPQNALLALKLLPEKANQPTHHRAGCFETLGLAYMDRDDYVKADEYFQKAVSDFQSENQSEFVFKAELHQLENLVKEKRYGEANKFYVAILPTLKQENKDQFTGNFLGYLRWSDPQIRTIVFRVRKALKAHDFSDLDAHAQMLTSETIIKPDGIWPVDEFYDALNGLNDGELNKVWEERIEMFKQWEKANPDSTTAKVALAKCLTSYAWKARGSGWASTVTEEGWRLFRERLERADEALVRVKNRDPNWYCARQVVALGQGWDRAKYDELVAECRKQYPNYYTTIFAKAHWILPKWYGGEGELEQYSEQQAGEVSGEDGGDVLYARIAWSLTKRVNALVPEQHMSWPKINSGFETLKKRFPSSVSVAGALSAIAMEYGAKDAAQAAYREFK
jgi:tetratricopeptide (TPR) repeat protein